tara:strand:+ start:6516 stop:7148 length:633 start_codon:yes stop_codon:yes gene_type:complete
MPKRSKSSDRWLRRQRKDHFARQAREGGQVSRAHFKLEQIDQRFGLLKSGMRVLELGAAPGGWTHYIQSRIGQGMIIAVDPLPVTAGVDTHVIEGCAGDAETDAQIAGLLADKLLHLVLSDMAPNLSGVRAVDQARSMDLADTALRSCERWLAPQGAMAIKAFQGEGLDGWVKALRDVFERVTMTKPKASRNESREVFVVAQGFSVEALG